MIPQSQNTRLRISSINNTSNINQKKIKKIMYIDIYIIILYVCIYIIKADHIKFAIIIIISILNTIYVKANLLNQLMRFDTNIDTEQYIDLSNYKTIYTIIKTLVLSSRLYLLLLSILLATYIFAKFTKFVLYLTTAFISLIILCAAVIYIKKKL